MDIISQRLGNQGLAAPSFTSIGEVTGWLGAVQAQDWAAAKWSLALRMQPVADKEIEAAFDSGEVIRTHVMRPTWHLIQPQDIRWLQTLTAERVKAQMAGRNRRLELDNRLFSKSHSAITKALRGYNYLTRQEIKKVLDSVGIATDVQRLAHIVMRAELDQLICSGPLRGRQFTYALLDERVPNSKQPDVDESLAILAKRYFLSHGPAQLKDFCWWSGLDSLSAKKALNLLTPNLERLETVGKTYWYFPSSFRAKNPAALLMSIFDEYTIAYKDRSDIGSGDIERMLSSGAAVLSAIVLDGKIAGSWKRVLQKNEVRFELKPFRQLSSKEVEAIAEQVERYGKFIGLPSVYEVN